jgi:alpha,alpha-trehalase
MHFPNTARRLAFLLIACSSAACAQQREPIDQYIYQGWDKLTRSTSDCASLVDPKVATPPVLYLPAHERIPAPVRAMQARCNVDVRHLPRTITHEGEVMPADVPTPGLLYLPHPYVVPGGRFNEMYGWDSYFILLGELADGRLSLARDTVENFFYEIDHYGALLNANRTYYLTRSQPPFLSSMVLAVYRELAKSDPEAAKKWLHESWPYLVRDHALWLAPPHTAGTTGLARYSDVGQGPVPEMSDASTYYVDAIQWMLAHPKETPAGYLEKAGAPSACPTTHCLQTQADGYRLTEAFFSGDRAMRESGFDTTFRFGPFGGSTDRYAPACLNILLYKYERDLAFIAARLGDTQAAIAWSSAAGVRLAAVNTLLWDDHTGMFTDLDFTRNTQSNYLFLTTFYALWAGLATPTQAERIATNLPLFERDGGLSTSTQQTGAQWDAPFGWAPLEWIAVAGLERYGYHDAAFRLAQKWTATLEAGYARDGTIREKYNVQTGNADVSVTAGYTQNVIGFGWTNAVYLRMKSFLDGHAIEQP